MEITRKKRMSDGMVFRIYDDLPNHGHWYSIEYRKEVDEHFHVWYPLDDADAPKPIPTLEKAYSLLYELTED